MKNQQKVVLVTGAAKRIGREIALYFAKQGWHVVVHFGQSKQEADQLVEEIQQLGQQAIALQCDLANEAQVRAIMPQAIQAIQAMGHMGQIKCVVNNASLFEPDTAQDFSQAALDKHMHINLMAPLILSQALFEATPANEQACVINLLDQKLYNLNPDFLSYTMSKAALQCATTTLAQALAPRVRVVGIAPGISLISGDQTEQQFQKAHQKTPLGKSSTPEDIANAVFFVANASAMTGTTILVDGGQHLIPLQRDVMFLK
jgi:NAD(P)-dependent dehydrogenase (short-subunit alcohol dehydrogenase family)